MRILASLASLRSAYFSTFQKPTFAKLNFFSYFSFLCFFFSAIHTLSRGPSIQDHLARSDIAQVFFPCSISLKIQSFFQPSYHFMSFFLIIHKLSVLFTMQELNLRDMQVNKAKLANKVRHVDCRTNAFPDRQTDQPTN